MTPSRMLSSTILTLLLLLIPCTTLVAQENDECLMCHEEDGAQMLDSAHFKWQGNVSNIVGLEGGEHGKNDLINNFYIRFLDVALVFQKFEIPFVFLFIFTAN